MSTRDLIERLRALGVKLAATDGELKISAPKGVFTEELRAEVTAQKDRLIELLSAAETREDSATSPIPRAPRDHAVPLSFAQQRMWFMEQFDTGAPIFNISWAMRIKGELDSAALEEALNDLVARHETLRTTFLEEGGEARQIIAPELHIQIAISHLDKPDELTLVAHLNNMARQQFDLNEGPLLAARLIELDQNDAVLMLAIHHIVADGWSLNILQNELFGFYAARTGPAEPELKPLPIQFADYAVWQQTHIDAQERDRQLRYWQKMLAGAPPVLDLPTDYPRTPEQRYRGTHKRLQMSVELQNALRALARTHNATLYMVLLAAFDVLLYRYTGQADIVVGTPIAGRQRAELEPLIGLFLNTLVMRADLSNDPAFVDLLKQVQKYSMDAYANQDLPFELLVDKLAPERNLSYAPVFQVHFMLQNAPGSGHPLDGLEISPVELDYGTSKFDLTMATGETASGLVAEVEYNTDLFSEATIERMLGHYRTLLEAIVADPARTVSELPLIGPAERRLLLEDWNATEFAYDSSLTMHGCFEAQAARQPEAPAVWHAGTVLSYAELNGRANRLVLELQARGAGPGTLIGVCMERHPDMLTGLIAILKSGAAYVPLDPNYPAERVAFMLDDSNAPIVLTQSDLAADLPATGAQLLCLDTFEWGNAAEPVANPAVTLPPDALGYVIYTSGSTGRPKGVAIEHRNAVALIQWARDVFPATEFAGVLASTSICFDLSVFEIFCTLGIGGRIVLVPDALALPGLPADANVTLVNTVPSAIAELVRSNGIPASVVTVNLAGEPLTTELADAIYATGTVQNVNDLYGPSEDTTYSTWTRRTPGAPASIGRPIHNTRAYVLDAHRNPVPIGAYGELYLGGSGVTRGYLNRPELTAERYVPDPFSTAPDARLYRTGDRVRYRPDGNLEYVGRIDHQVKLRGFRIELGEIETALTNQPEVDKAVVIVREDTPGDQRLVAYITAAGTTEPDSEALRRALRTTLPDFMLPAAFVVLDAIPLTPNGKTDRKALPAPEWTSANEYVAPRNATEQALADIWAATLGLDQVGVHDDFFALGGHSLLAMKLVSRIRDQLGREVPLAALFGNPTVADLADQLDEGGDATAAIPACDRSKPIPMSFAQQRLWFLHAMEPQAATYNVPWPIELHGNLNTAALQSAVDDLVARHESLRTTFADSDMGPVQLIAGKLMVPVRVHNLEKSDAGELQAELNKSAHQPFDLETGPPIRIDLLRLSSEQHVLLLCLHHAICDAWSFDILSRELSELYAANCSGRAADLPELPIQYADYAAWQRHMLSGVELERQFGYWKTQLADAPALLNLPLDKPRPSIETHVGRMESMLLDRKLQLELDKLARENGVTLFVLLLSAYQVLLHRYSGDNDIVIGTAISGRQRSELEDVIGFFLNTLAIRASLGSNPPFMELVKRNRQTTLDAFAHRDLPFEKLVEELQPVRSMSHAPIFQVLFVLTQQTGVTASFGDLTVHPAGLDYTGAKLDLELNITETPNGLATSVLYNVDLFEPATMQRLLEHFRVLLEDICRRPSAGIDSLQMITPAEKQWLLVDRNDTSRAYPSDSTIKSEFESQVRRTPDNIALVCGPAAITYAELNARANRLAHYLQERSIGPDTMVGVCMDRDIDTVIAIVAILKAGAAYLPLDPAYPDERLQFMMEDTATPIVISTSDISLQIGQSERIDIDAADLAGYPETDPISAATAENLAYVIYTSGSTGRPKGTLIENRSVLRLVLNTNFAEFSDTSRIAMLAPLSFDASTFEIWGSLLHGGQCVIFPERVPDIDALGKFLESGHIDFLFLTTTLFNTIIDTAPTILRNVRQLLTGGETLSVAHIRKALQTLPETQLISCYGPTESTTFTTTYRIPRPLPDGLRSIPIGKPIANTRVYVLNDKLQPVPPGIVGELYIGGDGLSRGYLNLAELTAELFVPDPFEPGEGRRLYKTGDLVRYLPDGNIDFIGRNDNQIKLRGFRIELGEIEHALISHPDVNNAAVVMHERRTAEKQLVAYIVTARPIDNLSGTLQKYLQEHMPAYMIPATYVLLDQIPRTANGKLDRKALPDPATVRDQPNAEKAAPQTLGEIELAGLWQRLLAIDSIGLDDNFFDLGGHSLLTMKLLKAIEERTGTRLTIADVFENPTVRELCVLLPDAEWQATEPEKQGMLGRWWRRLTGQNTHDS